MEHDRMAGDVVCRDKPRWRAGLLLAALPPMLTAAVYLVPWTGKPLLRLTPHVDAGFCVYEIVRAREVGMRYWLLGDDPIAGKPYPTGAAKHPGLYEGLDFLLIGSTACRFLPPDQACLFAVGTLLAINGWIAAGLTFRRTGSTFWSVIAATLLICNLPIALRAPVHANLLKVGYCLLAVSALFKALQAPSVRRGVWLGFTLALCLAGSFYLAYLLCVGFGMFALVEMAFRRLGARHLPALAASGLTFFLLGLAIAFPVWRQSRMPLAQTYFERDIRGVWLYGAELWQYLRAYPSSMPHFNWGGMLFPGYAVLAGLTGLAIAALRRRSPDEWSSRALTLVCLLVALSLRGGPGVWLFEYVKAFRCYDRAGLIAVGLAIVAVCVGGAAACRRVSPKWRTAICAAAVALTLVDAAALPLTVAQVEKRRSRLEGLAPEAERAIPGWANWLRSQPTDVRLAAFGELHRGELLQDHWHWESLYLRSAVHRHATLNGCEIKLLDADLHLLGASYAAMNEAGLRFVASLGYETLAFDAGYLAAHGWIGQIGWLTKIDAAEGWTIFRTNEEFRPYRKAGMSEIASSIGAGTGVRRVPAGVWITEAGSGDEPVVCDDETACTAMWVNDNGMAVGRPEPVLGQRVFSAQMPMLRCRTPVRPGRYRLKGTDAAGRTIFDREYEIDGDLERVVATAADRLIDMNVEPGEVIDGVRIAFRNPTDKYVAAKLGPRRSRNAFEWHPGLGEHFLTASLYAATWKPADASGKVVRAVHVLPADIPPRSVVSAALGPGFTGAGGGRLTAGFEFCGPAEHAVFADRFNLALEIGDRRAEAERPKATTASRMETAELGAMPAPCRMVAGDFTGDGRANLAGFDPATGVWYVVAGQTGNTEAKPWAFWSPEVRWGDVVVGDFNGDKRADIAGQDSATGVWYVAVSRGDRFETSAWSGAGPVGLANLSAADVDGDGAADLVGERVEDRRRLVWRSTRSRFDPPTESPVPD